MKDYVCIFQYLSPRITFYVEVSMEIAGQVLESKVSSLSEEMRRKVLQKIRSELENQILDRDETFVLSNPRKSTTIQKNVFFLWWYMNEPLKFAGWTSRAIECSYVI